MKQWIQTFYISCLFPGLQSESLCKQFEICQSQAAPSENKTRSICLHCSHEGSSGSICMAVFRFLGKLKQGTELISQIHPAWLLPTRTKSCFLDRCGRADLTGHPSHSFTPLHNWTGSWAEVKTGRYHSAVTGRDFSAVWSEDPRQSRFSLGELV